MVGFILAIFYNPRMIIMQVPDKGYSQNRVLFNGVEKLIHVPKLI